MNEGYRGKYMVKGSNKHPDADKLPKEILALKPTYIYVGNNGYAHIEMWGGMSYLGLVAYAEDFKKPFEGFKYGNKKLIDGIWFRSDFIDLNEENE